MINQTTTSTTITNGSMLACPSVIYFSVSGYGITWTYFLTHLVLVLVAVVGLFLNTMALKIVQVKSPLSDVSQTCISHLARSDICTSIICIYTVFYNLIHYKNYYECAIRTGLTTCVLLNSSIHLLSLTFDRYFKIMYPYKYVQLFTENRMKVFSFSAWIISGILGLLPILGWRRPPVRGTTYCSFFGVLERRYLAVICAVFYSIVLTIFYCYINILCVAWSHRRRTRAHSNDTTAAYNQRCTKSLWWSPARSIVILITFYTCCWLPSGIVTMSYSSTVFYCIFIM